MQKAAPMTRTSCVLFYSGKERKEKNVEKGRKDSKEERVPKIKGKVEKVIKWK